MAETNQIRAVDMARRIRDKLARELESKSEAEIIAFYRRAGDTAREAAIAPLICDDARLIPHTRPQPKPVRERRMWTRGVLIFEPLRTRLAA